jgi:lipoate-protein ligase B
MQLRLFDLGLADFQTAWDFQRSIFLQVKKGDMPGALIFCRHKPVITIGRQGSKQNILVEAQQLERLNIATFQIERGGDVTYHGPGQLCIYPIVNLACFKKDIHWFLRSLEALACETLSGFGIKAQTKSGFSGLWIRQAKIASIGIAIRNWITFHGIAINIKQADLANFSLIRPCGLDIIMTSMEGVSGQAIKINQVKQIFIRRWYERGNFAGVGRGD